MTTSTIVLVGCGSAKRNVDEPIPARDLYTSNYFALKRRYAEEIGVRWGILSAEHAFLLPGTAVRPYDTTIDDVEDLGSWADRVMGGVYATVHAARAFDGAAEVALEVLAGRDYVEPLRGRLASTSWTVRYPFDETSGIGDQMALLRDRLDDHQ